MSIVEFSACQIGLEDFVVSHVDSSIAAELSVVDLYGYQPYWCLASAPDFPAS